ncbi:hypothetical protein [Olsenella uli]
MSRWARFKEQVGWFVGDAACLLLIVLFLPLIPVFRMFDDIRRLHDEER